MSGRNADVSPAPSDPTPPGNRPQDKAWALRTVGAIVFALCSDFGLEFIPSPGSQVVDIMTGLVLFFLLGKNWLLLPFFVIEMIPGIGVFPTWTLAVASIIMGRQFRKSR